VTRWFVNEQSQQGIDCNDRGLQYGDGLFETISCVGGEPRWLDFHFERLQNGLTRLRIPFTEFDALREHVVAHARSDAQPCLVKLIVTRGAATRRGYRPVGDEIPTCIVSRHPWPQSNSPENEFRVGLSRVCIAASPSLAGLKHLNRLEQVMAAMECGERKLAEVLMSTATRHVISGSMSNVFLVAGETLVTPDLRDSGVAGVMRRVVLETAARSGLAVQVRPVGIEEIAGFNEAFVTNVRLGVQSVNQLEGRTLLVDDFAELLRSQINANTH
jgi:4-amino-4-deoxychorismate lyase